MHLQKAVFFMNAIIMFWCSVTSGQQALSGQGVYHDPVLKNEKLHNLPAFNTDPLIQSRKKGYLSSFIRTSLLIGTNQTYLMFDTTKVITLDWLFPYSSKEELTEIKSSDIEAASSEKIITSTGHIVISETSDSKPSAPAMQSYYVKGSKSYEEYEFLAPMQNLLELYPAPSVSHVDSNSLPMNKLAGTTSVTTSPLSSSVTNDGTVTDILLATRINASAASGHSVYSTNVSVLATDERHKTALIIQEPHYLHKVNEDDPERGNYNSNNHWEKEKPKDYDEKIKASYTKNWIHLKGVEGKDYKRYEVKPQLVKTMIAAANHFHLNGELSRVYLDFIEDEEETMKFRKDNGNLNTYAQIDQQLQQGDWFVRTDLCSLKRTQPVIIDRKQIKNGNRIYKSARELYLSIPTADTTKHTPIKPIDYDDLKGELAEKINLYLFPWKKLNPDKEFRVFVHRGRVTAISQQNLYQRNELLMSMSLEERQAQVEKWALQIIEYVHKTVVPSITHILSYSIDLAITETETDDEIYFIELNPFGKEYSSGSALFHWIKDEQILYGQQQENAVHFRYTVESDQVAPAIPPEQNKHPTGTAVN